MFLSLSKTSLVEDIIEENDDKYLYMQIFGIKAGPFRRNHGCLPINCNFFNVHIFLGSAF